jgi:PKD repeat protein
MRFLLTFFIIPALLVGSSSFATEYTFEIAWSVESTADVEIAGYRLYDLQHNKICEIEDPLATKMSCKDNLTGNTGTYTLVSCSTDCIESDPSDPFTITFAPATVPAELAAIIKITTTENSRVVTFDATGSTGQITQYTWDFHDGSLGSTSVTSHTFSTAGTYTVSLTVRDKSGAQATTNQKITLNQSSAGNKKPIASLVVSSAVIGDSPMTVTFDAGKSSDPEHSALTYFWDFGDGTVATGSQQVSHQYILAGIYTATVTVTDSQGAGSSISSQPILVKAGTDREDTPVPRATITVTGISGTVPVTVSFSGGDSTPSKQTGEITQYSWNFGDGLTGFGKEIQHTYMDPGNYTVQLTITDSLKKQAVATKTIHARVPETKDVLPALIQAYHLLILSD